jgi:nucleotide-binding universal stress UspA family protein
MKDILVPVDASDGANRAARFAGYIASETGAKLTLLFVYDAPTAAALGVASMSKEDAQQTVERVAQGSFDAARKELTEFDVPVETHVAMGHPANEIVAYARQHHPQLIVMGTRGLSPLEENLVGSVADYVLRHAPCPVTVHR